MALVPLLAYKLERHHTFAARETNIVLKLIFFQVKPCPQLISTRLACVPDCLPVRAPPCLPTQLLAYQVLTSRRQVLNVVVPSSAFIARQGWHVTDEWYPTGGQIILNSLLADFVFVGIIVDRWRPDVFFFRRQTVSFSGSGEIGEVM